MQRKVIYLILIISCFGIACSTNNQEVTIGVLFDSFNAPRFQKEKVYFENKIRELGGKAIIKTANGNELKQEEQARLLIEQGVDALIIIASNVNTAASIVRYANERGVKVIAYDRLIRNCELDYYVTFDGRRVGDLLAEYTLKNVPKGNYVLLNGDRADDNSTELYEGTYARLKPFIDSGDIKIIYTGFVDSWSCDNAAFLTKRILELSGVKIDAIISQYDGMTDGIVNCLENKKAGKVLVTGQDAEVAACKRILQGKQAMTIYKPVITMANKCVELTFDLIRNGEVDTQIQTNNGRANIPTSLFNPVVVDKDNLHKTVVADGFLSMQEIEGYLASNN